MAPTILWGDYRSDAVSAKALCYSLSEDQVVVFESGPLGGPQELLTAVSVLKRAEASFAAECAQPTRDLKKDVSCVEMGSVLAL